MSRLIDRLPTPERVREKKLIVLSRSRVGTFSLYQALKIVGYTPYHMYEVVMNGITHMNLCEEALRCKYQGAGKPYGKAEFDKWLANYDAIVEIPQFFTEEFIEFYPDAKFILTERDINAWERSLNNTIKEVITACKSFPINTVRYVDDWMGAFVTIHEAFETVFFHGKGVDAGMEDAKKDTLVAQERAKELLPKEKLLVCRLEDGFGWEEICPFLGLDIPTTPYPRGNAPAEFQILFTNTIGPRIKAASLKALTTVAVPLIGVGAWYALKG